MLWFELVCCISVNILRFLLCCFRLQHENIVKLIGCSTDGPLYCIVYEYVSHGSLEDSLACQVCSVSIFVVRYSAYVFSELRVCAQGSCWRLLFMLFKMHCERAFITVVNSECCPVVNSNIS